jgi:AcrR family transcriptional regulator
MVAAKRVFSENGFNKATMEDIAKEAELSPGTLYLYFKNKDELYASLTLRVLQYMNIRLNQIEGEEKQTTEERIQSLKKALMDVYEFDPLSLINMFHLQSSETLNNLSSELIADIKDLSTKSIRAVANIFESGIKEGAFIDKHPIALADIFWSLFSGVILWEETKKVVYKQDGALEQMLNTAFKIFDRGVTA